MRVFHHAIRSFTSGLNITIAPVYLDVTSETRRAPCDCTSKLVETRRLPVKVDYERMDG